LVILEGEFFKHFIQFSNINLFIRNNPKIDISPQNYLVDLDLKDGMCALAFETTDESNYDDDTYVLGTPGKY
jgi:hypothetical protein